ncbi:MULTISPECIES: BrnA antitoxin family protein [Roseomonadaceae]|jgi:uncharacterized protein (DUF4415 family)|uniref:BrnA antitoxin family protein n=1 Tax=Falsiroseomonas oleicola TaxID=2801474 RepID=A0ABS6H5F1_9PROT|nr:BrnA antitoxin family protein [Roseomonas oleicola]MBU8542978.1 BrnA antitoxin family protein [Roseomonas oleicola]
MNEITDKDLLAEAKRLAADATPPDTSDMPEVTDWSAAERGRFWRPVKRQVTLRLDADLLDYFARDGAGYQTRLNAALREWVESRRGR